MGLLLNLVLDYTIKIRKEHRDSWLGVQHLQVKVLLRWQPSPVTLFKEVTMIWNLIFMVMYRR